MITELHLSTFMREKVSFLAALARDFAGSLRGFAADEFPEEEPEEIDDRDVAELIGSLEAMERDPILWADPTSGNWLPRNAYAAILQASIDEYYRQNGCIVPAENRFGEKLRADPLVSANVTTPTPLGARRAGRFKLNKKDPRWVLVLKAKAIKRRRGTATFPDNSSQSTQFASRARMVLLGDWGSGTSSAIKLAKEIWKSYLLPFLGSELHVVHLGDVYYAGLPSEYKKNFLKDWPVPLGHEQDVKSWCLAGNHDMFSGGQSYFNMLKDPRFSGQNQSGYFLLENDCWQVFGLDTSFDPRDFTGNMGELFGEQAAWMAQKRAASSGRKCLILTHHQPFSAYETVEENLERRLRPIRVLGQIDAWFWGHEHLCAVYDGHEKVRYPVLLGHGGFLEKPKTKLLAAPPVNYEWLVTDPLGYLLFGCAVLDFDSSQIQVQLVDENGTVQHSFTIM